MPAAEDDDDSGTPLDPEEVNPPPPPPSLHTLTDPCPVCTFLSQPEASLAVPLVSSLVACPCSHVLICCDTPQAKAALAKKASMSRQKSAKGGKSSSKIAAAAAKEAKARAAKGKKKDTSNYNQVLKKQGPRRPPPLSFCASDLFCTSLIC